MRTTSHSLILRATLAAIAAGLGASIAEAQREHPTPAPVLPVEWGAPADSIVHRALADGWRFLEIDEDGDYAFHGRFLGVEAIIFATVGEEGLTRLLVSLAPHAGADSTFLRVVDTLRTRFGPAPLVTGQATGLRPAAGLTAAAAWRGIAMGLRWDSRIIMVFTCPAASAELPRVPGMRLAIVSS